ncbi:transthyretin-like protein-like protein [Calycina marina]|uniref:5-hydroxyisourate hydrolase n=1 Tax=Calycina marina TaxID=1763456 RepID=A0A9P7Z3R1_9HELO|nr:transthyretin-like protein-like protein [Calycina marina]
MATKDPITCHVLDTTTGRPAAHIIVSLSCTSSPSVTSLAFTAITDADGRISNWDFESKPDRNGDPITMKSMIEEHKGSSIWQLRFNTGAYYGEGKTFWPWVELTFYVKRNEHFHVPLLLGPFSYTTYRGS